MELQQLEQVRDEIAFSMIEVNDQDELQELEKELLIIEQQIEEIKENK